MTTTISLSIYSCAEKGPDDLINTSDLNEKVLRAAGQILISGRGPVVVHNTSTRWDHVDNQLLFYDKELKRVGSCYLPSIKVDSISFDVVYATADEEKLKRASGYLEDLPGGIYTSWTKATIRSNRTISNKVVDSMNLELEKQTVTMFVRESSDRFEGVTPGSDKTSTNYLRPYTLRLKLSDILFDPKENRLRIISEGENGEMLNDFILIRDPGVIDNFYDQLMRSLII